MLLIHGLVLALVFCVILYVYRKFQAIRMWSKTHIFVNALLKEEKVEEALPLQVLLKRAHNHFEAFNRKMIRLAYRNSMTPEMLRLNKLKTSIDHYFITYLLRIKHDRLCNYSAWVLVYHFAMLSRALFVLNEKVYMAVVVRHVKAVFAITCLIWIAILMIHVQPYSYTVVGLV